MEKQFPEALLHQPIASLDLSDTFKSFCEQYGYRTLADFLQLPRSQDMLKQKDFNMTLLMEFTHYLSANGMRHYLMPL